MRRIKSPIYISYGMSGKLDGIAAVNTDPLSNDFCIKAATNPDWVCFYCYARKNAKGYRANCVNCWKRNSQVLSESILPLELIPTLRKGTKVLRFNAYGELVNKNHYINFANIAIKNPLVQCSLYTKRPNLVDVTTAPANLTLVYSSYKLNEPAPQLPPGFHHLFAVYTLRYLNEHNILSNCTLECFKCLKCYGRRGATRILEVVKKDQAKYKKYLLTISAADNIKNVREVVTNV